MCTTLLAGKNATVSGSVLFGANDDWDNVPGVLTHVPRCTHAPGTMYRMVGGLEIPEIPETCGYSFTACHYDIGFLDKGWAGGVNDRNVAVAGTGACAFQFIEWEGHQMEPDDVQLLILRRATSAGDYTGLDDDAMELKNLIFRRSYTYTNNVENVEAINDMISTVSTRPMPLSGVVPRHQRG